MDTIMLILCVVFPLALARNSLGLKQEYRGKIEIFDDKFSRQVARLTSLKTIEGVDYLGTAFGYVLLVAMMLNIALIKELGLDLTGDDFIPQVLLVSLIGWISIKWYTQPHKYSISFLKGAIQVSSLALFMPLIDLFFGVPYVIYFYDHLYNMMELQGAEIPREPHVIIMGVFLFMMMSMFIVTTWVFTSFAMFFVFLFVFSGSYFSLKVCSTAEKYFGKRVLNFFLIVGVISTQAYAW